jgi:PncC family amidohydrolase
MEEALEILAGQWLRKRKLSLITAESCTGGLIGHWMTNVPGSSDYFAGGVVAYAYEAKMSILGVPPGLLAQYGAVSRETVLAMADGARQAVSSHLNPAGLVGLSVSGIAGPGGGMPGKPVGLTWIGLSAEDYLGAWHFVWPGDRVANKEDSAHEALRLLIEFLQGNPRSEA